MLSVGQTNDEIIQEVYGNHNMEEFDMDGTLSREYLIDTITWSTSSASSAILGTYQFPDVLFAQQFIAEKTDDFRYFRAGVELSVRCTSNKFVYGKLIVGWQPYSFNTNQFTSLLAVSNSPHMLVSATAEEVAIFKTPFVSIYRFMDIANWQPGEMGEFTIWVLNPLIDINGDVNTATVVVTARFLEPKLSMPYAGFLPSYTLRQSRLKKQEKDRELLKTGIVAVKSQSKRSVVLPVIVNDSSSDYDMDFHTESRVIKGAESRAKSSAGLLSSALENLTALASSISAVPLVSNYAKAISSVSKPMTSIAKTMGLSKPMSQNVGQSVLLNHEFDLNYGKGIDGCQKFGMDPENAISTLPNVAGVSEDEMLLTHIVGTPSLILSLPFNPGTGATQIASTQITNYQCYVDFVANSFFYHAGTFKYKLYITASLMHNVRAVIYLINTAYGTDWQQCYHRIIEIKGDTEVDFTIPYCAQTVMEGYGLNSGFAVVFKILAWSAPNPTLSLPIYVNVYKAGASDFRFGVQMDYKFTASSRNLDQFHCQSHPREDFNKDFQPLHPSFKGYSTKNLVMGEEFLTLREILHRYHAYTTTNAAGNDYLMASGHRSSGSVWHGIEYWGLLFRFWRGSVRFKYMQNWQKIDGTVIVKIDNNIIFGVAQNVATAYQQTSVIEFEVPYYSPNLFNETLVQPADVVTLNYDNQPRYMFKSAGDDFSFHFLCGPQGPGTVTQFASSTNGILGYQNYLDV
jgi:hypothetical protein